MMAPARHALPGGGSPNRTGRFRTAVLASHFDFYPNRSHRVGRTCARTSGMGLIASEPDMPPPSAGLHSAHAFKGSPGSLEAWAAREVRRTFRAAMQRTAPANEGWPQRCDAMDFSAGSSCQDLLNPCVRAFPPTEPSSRANHIAPPLPSGGVSRALA